MNDCFVPIVPNSMYCRVFKYLSLSIKLKLKIFQRYFLNSELKFSTLQVEITKAHLFLFEMSHNFSNNVIVNNAFSHTSCIYCGCVVGSPQAGQHCPNAQQGKIYLNLIIVPHSKFCIIYLFL